MTKSKHAYRKQKQINPCKTLCVLPPKRESPHALIDPSALRAAKALVVE
jgi:hypothetical protein